MEALHSVTADLARMALDAYMARHKVIAHNIANHDTEGNWPLRLNFEEQLAGVRRAVASGAGENELKSEMRHIRPFIEPAESDEVRLDDEMVALSRNVIEYEAVLTALEKRGALIRTVLGQGGR